MLQKTPTAGAMVSEFIVEDSLVALNSALESRGIQAADIISIIAIAAITPAIGDWKAKLRVLHRS